MVKTVYFANGLLSINFYRIMHHTFEPRGILTTFLYEGGGGGGSMSAIFC